MNGTLENGTAPQQQENGTAPVKQEKTFTQDEVNAIVEGRLKKESAKYSDYEDIKSRLKAFEDADKSELEIAKEQLGILQKQIDDMNQEKAIRSVREKVSKDIGVPAELLQGTTEEECMEQAYAILQFKNNSPKYPTIKDGGEITDNLQGNEVEQFKDWLNQSL